MTQAQPQNDSEPEAIESQNDDSTPNAATADVALIGHNEPPEEVEFDPKQRVEFSTPEQQKKFNDLYKQVKMSDARNHMQSDMLAKAMEKLNELESRFSQTDHAEAERILTSRLKDARESGDEDKADRILQEIIDFRVDSKLKTIKVEKPIQPQKINDPDVQAVVQFAQETDLQGNLLRPWIDANNPNHNNAMKLAGAIATEVNAEFGYVDINEIMARMDKAMKQPALSKPQGNSRSPDPMRGNLTNRPAQGKMKLSSLELAAAQKLGVKPEDYLKYKR